MKVTNVLGVVCFRTVMTFGLLGATPVLAAGPAAVDLGSADTLVILSKSAILNAGPSSIVGDIGVSPNGASFINGFNLALDGSGRFATSLRVDGFVFAADYQIPTPARLSAAVADMDSAYLNASTRTPADFTGLHGGDLTGRTLAPGLYKWNSGVLISTGGVTLAGGPDDVWIFQIGQDLTVAPQGFVTLAGGARPTNIFWQVAGKTTLDTMSRMNGIVLCGTQIVMNPGSSLLGTALAQGSVSLDSSTVVDGTRDTIFIDGFEQSP